MAINMNGTSLTKVVYNGTDCGKVTYNGTTVFIRVDSASGYWVSNWGGSRTDFQYGMTMPSTSAQQTGTRVTVRSDRYANNPNEGTYYRDVYRGLSADYGSSGYKIQGTYGLKYIRVQNYYDYGGNRYYGTYWDTTYQYGGGGGCGSNCSNSSCCDSSCDSHTCSNCSHCSNCGNCPHGCADCSNSGGPHGGPGC